MLRWSLKDAYQQLDPTKTRILLIDPGETVRRSMPEELSKQALQVLQKRESTSFSRVMLKVFAQTKWWYALLMESNTFAPPP